MPKPKTTNRNRGKNIRVKPEFEQKLVDLARVTRVVKGGKRLRFRACLVIGDQKGKIGFGIAKGTDVSIAVNKAMLQAKKNLLQIDVQSETIPHEIRAKYGAAQVLLRPARKGHGLVAGGVVRVILTLAGFKNLTAKILGSDSKINNVKATMKALETLTESSQEK
jgi:small subunit ribosomal protein S5